MAELAAGGHAHQLRRPVVGTLCQGGHRVIVTLATIDRGDAPVLMGGIHYVGVTVGALHAAVGACLEAAGAGGIARSLGGGTAGGDVRGQMWRVLQVVAIGAGVFLRRDRAGQPQNGRHEEEA